MSNSPEHMTSAQAYDSEIAAEFRLAAERSRQAAHELAQVSTAGKNAALLRIADDLVAHSADVIAANKHDVDRARHNKVDESIIDRLTLNEQRIADIAQAVRDVSELPDPVGSEVRSYTAPNGLKIRQVRVPIGVVGMIYEARPNVTVDAAVLALKAGSAALLRGSSSALDSNVALVNIMQRALAHTEIPSDAVQLVPGNTHESVNVMLKARGLVDLIIPRGGASLINSVVENSIVPVIETGVGNCTIYVDQDADLEMAADIVMNAKTQRVSVCNAAESLLVHESVADTFLPVILQRFADSGVTVHGDSEVLAEAAETGVKAEPATEEDWAAEYGSMDIAAKVVDSLDEAVDYIRQYSSGHTEAIITGSQEAADAFTSKVDSAAVLVNASTRFTDGGEFGFGAEIGISTQKLHARGPMGLQELTTTKFIVLGDGHVRS